MPCCLELGPWEGGHEGGALINGISVLLKEATESPCPFCHVMLPLGDFPEQGLNFWLEVPLE